MRAGLHCAGAGDAQGTDHLDDPGLRLRNGSRGAPENRSSDLLGIETIRLAVHTSSHSIRPVHLDNGDPGFRESSGQRCSERTGAFDADRPDLAVAAHPAQQCLIAGVGCWELAMAEEPALVVDRCRVVSVLVGVDATDHGDSRGRCCHAVLLRWVERSELAGRTTGL